MNRQAIPKLPVFGWQALTGGATAVPCMLDLPNLHYTTSGRASILLALEALAVGPGQRVLLPTYHCPTMVAPVTYLGAVPVFYPIDEHGTPQLHWLREQDLTDVRVLLAPHYFGLPQPMAQLRQWCDEHSLTLIEDCAHALFGRAGDRPIGAWGDVAIGSLTKFLPMPEGGCLVMNTPRALRSLGAASATNQARATLDLLEVGAAQGRLRGLNTLINGSLNSLRRLRGSKGGDGGTLLAESSPTSGEATGAELQIDVSLAQRQLTCACRWVAEALPRNRVTAPRRQHYAHLTQALSGLQGLRPLMPQLPPDCVPYVFPLWVDNPDPGYAELRRLGMPVFRWDRLWPNVPHLAQDNGRQWSHHVIQLACHQDLTAGDLDRFVQHLLRLYKEC
jgi:perosamine synthetase